MIFAAYYVIIPTHCYFNVVNLYNIPLHFSFSSVQRIHNEGWTKTFNLKQPLTRLSISQRAKMIAPTLLKANSKLCTTYKLFTSQNKNKKFQKFHFNLSYCKLPELAGCFTYFKHFKTGVKDIQTRQKPTTNTVQTLLWIMIAYQFFTLFLFLTVMV